MYFLNTLKTHVLKISLLLIAISYLTISCDAQKKPDFLKYKNDAWVDSVLQSLTLEEKIAQTMMVGVYSNRSITSQATMLKTIKEKNIGGVIFFQGGPVRQAKLTNYIQKNAKTPVLVAIDGEWGLSMRLDSTIKYPYNIALGAIKDDSLLYEMGNDLGEQCKRLGIHVNFAPVVDVNNNPKNPVIGFRSYGENPERVGQKASYFASGIQSNNVLAVAKHFPGHGDTDRDSHKSLPVISHNKERLSEVELTPFREVIKNGIGGVMSGHLNITAYDNRDNYPASLSKPILTGLLKEELGFEGLIVTDGMNMRGLTSHFSTKEAATRALDAGNDLLEILPSVTVAIQGVKESIATGKITEQQLDNKCRKLLAIKRWCGLNKQSEIDENNIVEDLQKTAYENTNSLLYQNALTVLENKQSLIPLKEIDTLRIAAIAIGGSKTNAFYDYLSRYAPIDYFEISKTASESEMKKMSKSLSKYDVVISGIHGMKASASRRYGLSEQQRRFVNMISGNKNSIIAFFGNPYALNYFNHIELANTLVVGYQDTEYSGKAMAELLFGGLTANGTLPVTINHRYKEGWGLPVGEIKRFHYIFPEELGIPSSSFEQKLDPLIENALNEKAFPGCQIFIAKAGNVMYHKCYGFHTYEKKNPVQKTDIYDWASITKVTGPLMALMKLYDNKKLNLDTPMSTYWPRWKETNKKNLKMRAILAHQARLEPYIPFWARTFENGAPKEGYYSTSQSDAFPTFVSDTMYLVKSFKDTIYQVIDESELLTRTKYKYSGLSFLIYPEMISNLSGKEYTQYLNDTFYKPLGASSITFRPLTKFDKKEIIPTEYDKDFRQMQMQGVVHDEAAAMLGGISGNAGLFGSITDCAKIFQMLLNEGEFGGKQYLSKSTVNEFTRIQYPKNENRRGLGFDKPYIDNQKKKLKDAYPAISASKESFGHTGFTGTFAWVDPKNELLVLFFSNRVYPTRNNKKIYNLNLRPEMHQAIYDIVK